MTRYTERYRATLQSARWRSVRAARMRQTGYRCERCGARRVRLDGHHFRGYRMLGHETPADIKMLCHECHLDAHGRGREGAVRRTLWRLTGIALILIVLLNWHGLPHAG